MPGTDKTLMTIAGAACVVCCLPLIVAAGPVIAVGGAVAAGAGVAAHTMRKSKAKRTAEERPSPPQA